MLTVSQAVRQRHSVRAYLSRPVERGVVERILTDAARAPSGGNLQPWHVDVLAGEALDELRARVRERLAAGLDSPEYQSYPSDIRRSHADRRRAGGEALYAALGHRAGRQARPLVAVPQELRAVRRAGWPVLLDRSRLRSATMGASGHVHQHDHAARRGTWAGQLCAGKLGGRPSGRHPSPRYPPERMLYCGLALGYPDREHPINGFRTEREPLDAFASFRGF
jgi:nitroreductase